MGKTNALTACTTTPAPGFSFLTKETPLLAAKEGFKEHVIKVMAKVIKGTLGG